MSSQGSSGNVLAALVSFFFPGLGQLCQGRIIAALLFFLASAILWIVWLGWLVHILAAIDAARYSPQSC